MSSYDKLLRAATKPKAGAPKAKHIDPLIAASFARDGSLADVLRALAIRLREGSTVVFKSLIVLHTLIRNGGLDNVLSHLASEQGKINLRAVAQGGNWQGSDAPRSLAAYAAYLDSRVGYYREMKHDAIRAADVSRTGGGSDSAHRLRTLSVEKGLLRAVGNAQKVCGRVLECSFFFDDLNDEMTITAFRMTLKDLLALYTAINEGMINILEHYFEMSKPDATKALDIYKRFTRHTEKVVAYLSAARKASHSLNVPIPNLKHAPISLAGALGEYLDDANFEENRREYRRNRRAAEGLKPDEQDKKAAEDAAKKKKITIKEPTAEEKVKPSAARPASNNQALQDFFDSIETEQQSMFGPSPSSSQQFGAGGFQPAPPQMGFLGTQPTGQAFGMLPQQQQMMTGMPAFGGAPQLQPQATGFNPFLQQQQMQAPQMMQPQITGFAQGGYLQPQMTGFNPFRASMSLSPQMQQQQFGQFSAVAQSPTPQQQPQQQQPQQPQQQAQPQQQPAPQQPQPTGAPAFSAPSNAASTLSAPSGSSTTKLLPQKTGSRNPFAPPPGSTPPPSPPSAPKGPSLNQLAMSAWGQPQGGHYGLGAGAWNGGAGSNGVPQQQQPEAQQQQPASSGLVPMKTGLIGSIASEFAFGRNGTSSPAPPTPQAPSPAPPAATNGAAPNGAAQSNGLPASFSGLSLSNGGLSSPAPLAPQPTGYAGSSVKPFQPTSSFGTSLAALSSPGAQPTQPATALSPQYTSANPFAPQQQQQQQAQQQSQQQQQQPQQTGFGSSLFASPASPQPPQQQQQQQQPQQTGFGGSLFASSAAPLQAQPTGFAGSSVRPFQPTSAFGSAAFGSALGQQLTGQPPYSAPAAQPQTGTLF